VKDGGGAHHHGAHVHAVGEAIDHPATALRV
jgi:hypothetical protein